MIETKNLDHFRRPAVLIIAGPFADDAVIFSETLELLVGALETLSSELEPPGMKVSWNDKKQDTGPQWLFGGCTSVGSRMWWECRIGRSVHLSRQ